MAFYYSTEPPDIYTDRRPTDRVIVNSETPFTPKYIIDNVTRASDPTQVYASRVKGRQLLLDKPSRESRAKKEKEAQKIRKTSNKTGVVRSRNSHNKNVWKLTSTKFDLFLPLHQLWMDYMSELLGLAAAPSTLVAHDDAMPSTTSMHAKLVKADVHGAFVTVRKSKNPCLIGISGIVIHETENTVKIVTKADSMKLIPKAHSVFSLAVPLYSTITRKAEPPSIASSSTTYMAADEQVVAHPKEVLKLPHIEFELYGNQFCFRSADRASRKFKHKETIEL